MIARILVLMGGANVHPRDDRNYTALSYAKLEGHERMAALIRHSCRLSKSNSYAYSPLSKPSQIRVFDLLPGQKYEAISLRLYEVGLHDGPAFEAVSYEWKDKVGSIPVRRNDKSLLITPNLKPVLQHIRLPGKKRTLWVDAVCINQENIRERSTQVQIMTNIYQKASKVLMWVGEDSPNIGKAVASIPAAMGAWSQLTLSDIFTYLLSGSETEVGEGQDICCEALAAARNWGLYSPETVEGAAEMFVDHTSLARGYSRSSPWPETAE
jgi:hypothetical protein